ncbi:MAG: hypothetical protein LBC55_01025 [Desulfovibrio sp.]|nr:hypothetical protein [Desulfovibrio sp.]
MSPYEARKVARGIERNITRARQLGLRLFRESFKSLGITACDQPAAPAASAKVKITDVSKGDEAEAKGRSFKDYVYKHDIISPRACEAAGVSQKEVRKVARGMERYVRRARELGVAAFSPCEAGLRVVLSPAPTEPVECKEAGIPAAQAAEAEIVDRSAIRPKPVRRKRVSHARAKDAPRAKPRMPGRLKKGETEKAGKIPWSLTFCPYADGSMKIEGDRMPDPAWGF